MERKAVGGQTVTEYDAAEELSIRGTARPCNVLRAGASDPPRAEGCTKRDRCEKQSYPQLRNSGHVGVVHQKYALLDSSRLIVGASSAWPTGILSVVFRSLTHPPNQMDVAIVGCGDVAGQYAPAIANHEALQTVAVADLKPERAASLSREHDAVAYTDLGTLLPAKSIGLLLNLTSHAAHSLVDTAADRGVVLGCAPYAIAGDAQRLVQRLLDDGRLGPVRRSKLPGSARNTRRCDDRPP